MIIVKKKNGSIVEESDPEKPVLLVRIVYADPKMEEAILRAVKAEMERRQS